jgi:hypothetical protein
MLLTINKQPGKLMDGIQPPFLKTDSQNSITPGCLDKKQAAGHQPPICTEPPAE